MSIAIPTTRPRETPMRLDEVEVIARSRHRDVQQPPLLLDLFFAPRRHVRGNTAVDHVQDVDDVPFLALGRMDSRENQVILIDERVASEIAERFGGIQREIREEALAALVIAGEALERFQSADANRGSLVKSLEMRLVPFAHHSELARPLRSMAQCIQQPREAGWGCSSIEPSACVRLADARP